MYNQALAIALIIAGLLVASRPSAPSLVESFERERGNEPYGKYPPCYDICGATRSIYDRLEEESLLEEHAKLLELYSVVLCQEKHLLSKPGRRCSETMMDQRIRQLRSLGANERDPKALALVRKYVTSKQLSSPEAVRFLVAVTNLLEREFARLEKGGNLTRGQVASLRKLHDTFYMVHYDKIVCPL